MIIKRNIIFSLEGRKKNGIPITDNVPIRMRVTYARHRIDFSTGYRIDAAKWNNKLQRVRNGCSNKLKQTAAEINADLNTYYTNIQALFKAFEVEDIVPSPEQLKKAFSIDSDDSATDSNDFMPVFSEFLKENGEQSNWAKSTYKNFGVLSNHLKSFDPKLTLNGIDEAKMICFVDYLRNSKDMRNSSIAKQIRLLKWFLRWCARKGYISNFSFESFRPKFKTSAKRVIFLTKGELDKLRNYKIPASKTYLERVRDVFLFTCFTGLRYSDAYNLKRSDIKDNYIEVTTVKTADNLIIELNNHSRAILDKYKDAPFKDDKVLPVISNQKMNTYLKELCELAGIDEPVRETFYKGSERIDVVTPKYELIGTHAGRRTFICNALSFGTAAQVVMKWTGHNDYKSMKPYIDVADEIKANEMTKFNEL